MQTGNRGSAVITGLALFIAGALLGVWFGYQNRPEVAKVFELTGHAEPQTEEKVSFDQFWTVWNILNEKFVKDATSTEAINPENKVYGAIQGLVRSYGDPYTVFFPPREKEIFESDIKGNFEGVGMEVGIADDIITVITPLKGSPAEKAGVLPGDKILQIDEAITGDLSVDDAVSLIRGTKGTSVVLTIFREGDTDTRKITIVRDVITIPTLSTSVVTSNDKNVFVIALYNFSAPSAELFKNALVEYQESKAGLLILDLRGNPGGYLEASVDMASWFLPAGKVIVREYFGPDLPEEIQRSKGYSGLPETKMVILINQGSASASEILAGALQEHGVATLVGEQSFGKGSVQELINVPGGTALKVTIARWLTPEGVSLSAGGLKPDVEVVRTAEDFISGKDPQMEKAIELLTK